MWRNANSNFKTSSLNENSNRAKNSNINKNSGYNKTGTMAQKWVPDSFTKSNQAMRGATRGEVLHIKNQGQMSNAVNNDRWSNKTWWEKQSSVNKWKKK